MDIKGLGYVGVRAKSLEDWATYGTRFLGMQLTDKSARSLALRMDDRRQRVVVDARAREAKRSRELAEQGRLKRLWSVRGLPGRPPVLGLWGAADAADMAATVESLRASGCLGGGASWRAR